MTRNDLETIQIGQAGFYEWDPALLVCRLGEVMEVLVGAQKGKAFRYLEVQAENATIGFTVKEG